MELPQLETAAAAIMVFVAIQVAEGDNGTLALKWMALLAKESTPEEYEFLMDAVANTALKAHIPPADVCALQVHLKHARED